MVSQRIGAILAVGVVALFSGCGTLINLGKDREVYGGVRLDSKCGEGGLDIWRHPDKYAQPVFPYASLLAAACWVGVDLPLSAVADTLTLPLTIPTALKRAAEPAKPDQPAEAVSGDSAVH